VRASITVRMARSTLLTQVVLLVVVVVCMFILPFCLVVLLSGVILV